MNVEQVALQLYTLRDHLKTPEDIRATLKRVREIGYQAVQVSGMGPIPEAELVAILKDLDITLCATHEPGATILDDPAAIVDRMQKLGCALTAFPHPGKVPMGSLEEVRDLARRLNDSGRVLHEAGITLTYHNHSTEFKRVGGKTILEILYAETSPDYVQGEIDTYWVQHGGGNSEEWCRALKGRLPILHLKDYVINAENQPTFCEVGAGNLNWPGIIAAAEDSGCQWFAVEQDRCPGDAFDSVTQSFEYIRDHLCSA